MNKKYISILSLLLLTGFVGSSKAFFGRKLTEAEVIEQTANAILKAADNCGEYDGAKIENLRNAIENCPEDRAINLLLREGLDRAGTNKHKLMAKTVNDIVKANEELQSFPWYQVNHVQALEMLTDHYGKERIEREPSYQACQNCSKVRDMFQDLVYPKS